MVFVKISLRRRKPLGDPGGVMATLQIARRLVSEWGNKAVYPALDEALPMAAPKDRARAWWAAHRFLLDAVPAGYADLSAYVMADTSHADVLALMDSAIKECGRQRLSGVRK